MTEILEELWTFTNVQRRMILHDSLATRQAGNISSLQRLSRETVQLSLLTNNSQERKAGPLVDKLGEDLNWNNWETGKKLLRAMASFPGSGVSNYCFEFCPHYQYFRSAGPGWGGE